MFYFTYVLKSLKDDRMYIGWTNNLRNRIESHNKGNVESTAERRPLQLIYYEACNSRDSAIKRERFFKTGFGRRYLKNRTK
ncbi:MAG: GIY-YIG nuclease family protein [Candidatus Vogelbacteria bacterium]|nr:GIY-YIG nuclease family protein [Candidatus Vogelbacteria bacterium]